MIPDDGDGWARLDARKLLLDPVRTLRQFLFPAAIAILGIRQSTPGNLSWWLIAPLALLGPIVLGAIPYLTTYFRITDTQVQLRSGLLNKHSSTAPLDRVRSVDLEASLLHRILGLEKVQIGTGVDDDRITLDALSRDDARHLRTTLLHRTHPPVPAVDTDSIIGSVDLEPTGAATPLRERATPAPRELARINWSWLRFAPFSLARLVLVAGAVGVLFQFGDNLPLFNERTATSAWAWVAQFARTMIILATALVGLVGWIVVAVVGYVIQWWNFRLVREHDSLHLTYGLFTTRSISVEEAKVRGVVLTEPALLRIVRGAGLATLATGVESGVTEVLPACPRPVAVSVGEQILRSREPLTQPLMAHGFRARRRAWLAQLRLALVWPVVAALALWQSWIPGWLLGVVTVVALLLAAVLAESTYRHLGHTLTDGHLVAGSGTLARIRTVLETDGIIGWVFAQSWWQRRGRLTDLVATTAAGSERVIVHDVPLDTAVALANAATPGLLTGFLDAP